MAEIFHLKAAQGGPSAAAMEASASLFILVMTVVTVAPSTIATLAPDQGGPRVDLDAQLARLRQQLADCQNCASSTTTQGKERIQQLQLQISNIEARRQASEKSSGDGDTATATHRTTQSTANTEGTLQTLGSRLDTYA